jgi:hypothetical protein
MFSKTSAARAHLRVEDGSVKRVGSELGEAGNVVMEETARSRQAGPSWACCGSHGKRAIAQIFQMVSIADPIWTLA